MAWAISPSWFLLLLLLLLLLHLGSLLQLRQERTHLQRAQRTDVDAVVDVEVAACLGAALVCRARRCAAAGARGDSLALARGASLALAPVRTRLRMPWMHDGSRALISSGSAS